MQKKRLVVIALIMQMTVRRGQEVGERKKKYTQDGLFPADRQQGGGQCLDPLALFNEPRRFSYF